MNINLATIDFCPGQGGVTPSGTLSITSNGTYDVYSYASAEVSVSANLGPCYISENGNYYPWDLPGDYEGFNFIGVNVPSSSFVTESLSVSQNGIYTPGEGVNGFSQVVVDVPLAGYTEKEITEGVNIANLNNSASYVKNNAFYNSSTLLTISLPYCSTIGIEAFKNCYNLESVYLPECTYIDKNAFQSCIKISQINLPKCKSVNQEAFANCWNLESVNLPECSYINIGVFNNCIKISQINLPKCKSVNKEAFLSCYNLESVNLPECSYIGSYAFSKCSSLTTVSFPKISEIYAAAFANCWNLESVSLPECTYISNWAFNDCSSLSVIDLPILGSMGGSNFIERCSSLTTIYLDSKTYEIAKYFLSTTNIGVLGSIYTHYDNISRFAVANGWSSVSSLFVSIGDPDKHMLTYSDGVVSGYTNYIEPNFYTYFNMTLTDAKGSITSVNLSECLKISNNTFSNYTNITDVDLSECTYIGSQAFAGCRKLSHIELPKCEYIDNYGFYNCSTSLTTVSLPKCTYIGDNGFGYCNSLTTVSLPECTYINNNGFGSCNSLTSIELPKCSYIGSSAFHHCSSLATASLPKCTYIGAEAFYWLQNLSEVYLPGSEFCSIFDSEVFSQYSLQTPLVSFYVNASLVDTYKNDSKWSWYSSRIFPIV